jgi:hypothetical protein
LIAKRLRSIADTPVKFPANVIRNVSLWPLFRPELPALQLLPTQAHTFCPPKLGTESGESYFVKATVPERCVTSSGVPIAVGAGLMRKPKSTSRMSWVPSIVLVLLSAMVRTAVVLFNE